jgi:hypothetical protein
MSATNQRLAYFGHRENYADRFVLACVLGVHSTRALWHRREREVTHRFEAIALHKEKKLYFIDANAKGDHIYQCWTERLEEPFHTDCVPSNAKHDKEITIGGTLHADLWTYHIAFRNVTMAGYEIRAKDNCFLIEGVNRVHKWGAWFHSVWDMTSGIKNPAIFTPPAQCVQRANGAKNFDVQELPQAVREMIGKADN